jgi:malonyl-CoA O-methyltransferase
MINSKLEICTTFNNKAITYEQSAIVQREIGERLFERLEYLKITPRYVLDLGCGPGIFSAHLKKKYPNACIIALDVAFLMLLQARKKQRLWRKWSLLNADMTALPFANGLFDLIFANQVIHWSEPLSCVFREINRVMNADGCFMFSTLGPDTFKELKQSWQHADKYSHANLFADMHDVGDYLMAEQFLDPVVDMELLTIHYASLSKLMMSLKSQGVRNINQKRNHGLTGRQSWQRFQHHYQTLCTSEGKYPLTYEVVYGHAWKGQQRRLEVGHETVIPIAHIHR